MAFTSEYALSLTSSIATSLIELGRTQSGVVATDEYVFYRLSLSEQGHNSLYTLRITAAATSGHVAVFASCQHPMVKRNTSSWHLSPALMGSYLDITSFAVVEAGCLRSTPTIYFSIYGWYSAAAYTVSAQIMNNASVSILTPNHAASGTISCGTIDYYYLRPSTTFEDVEVLVTLLFGDVDLYVSSSWDSRPRLVNGRMQSYDFKSDVVGSDDIVISHQYIQQHCNEAPKDCYVIVAVYAVYGTVEGNTQSSYTLIERTHDSIITLTNGVPRRGQVGAGNIDYYKFSLLQKEVDVTISVSALSGDPGILPHINLRYCTHSFCQHFSVFVHRHLHQHGTELPSQDGQHYVGRDVFGSGHLDASAQ